MPSDSPGHQYSNAVFNGTTTGDATGASTARDATDVIGTANPDTESQITSTANTNRQIWGHRRFVSRPLAAQTISFSSSSWAFSSAFSESNLNHNQAIVGYCYAWRPSINNFVGSALTNAVRWTNAEPTVAATETTGSPATTTGTDVAISNGDILVFDICTDFTQAMSTAYTDNFAYDGTTEASTTTCASFITPPSALTLYLPTSDEIDILARRQTSRRGTRMVKV
jgi:hypothetical protein